MAKGKITLQALSEIMASNTGRSKTATEAFVRTFFSTLKDALAKDNIIKIKGFGTFKMVVVNARESINVNTGKRVSISEYNKITFTPDKTLKEKINRPFSQFETISLDEGDVEIIEHSDEENNFNDDFIIQNNGKKSSNSTSETSMTMQNSKKASDSKEESAKTDTENSQEKENVDILRENVPTGSNNEENITKPVRKKGRFNWIWMVLLIILFSGGAYLIGYMHLLTSTNIKQQKTTTAVVKKIHNKTVSNNANGVSDTLTSRKKTSKDSISLFPQIQGGKYYIVGTRTYRKIKPTYDIRRYCLQIYGSEDMVPYVLLYNNIDDNSKVPVGSIIKFPKLIVRDE